MRTHPILFAILFIVGIGADARAAEAPKPAAAWEKIQTLAGDWEAPLEGGKVIRVNYKVMSGGTILVETFRTPSGRETLSVYHLDGDRLLLTHYCGQGNQPRLRYDAKKSGADRLVFTFLDATSLPSKKAEHMVRLEAAFLDADHFDQASTYGAGATSLADISDQRRAQAKDRAGTEEETTTLHFARVKGE